MSDQADKLAQAIRALLREHLQSPTLRALARELAGLVLEEAVRIESQPPAPGSPVAELIPPEPQIPVPQAAAPQAPAPPPAPLASDTLDQASAATPPPREPAHVGIVPLAIGDALAHVAVPGSRADLAAAHRAALEPPVPTNGHMPREEIDLPLLARRSRLKAASCRLYVRRRAAADNPESEQQILAAMNQMIEQARALRDCFLWVFWRYEEQPEDDRLELIALNYETLAESADLCDSILHAPTGIKPAHVEQAFQMLAEADSALRRALQWTWLTNPDVDQDEAHNWLRQQTWERQVFVPRYMKVSDPADPHRAADLLSEIRSLVALLSQRKTAAARVESILNKLRYHARRLPAQGAGDSHDAARINDCVEDLLEIGVEPDDARIRDALRSVRIESFPPDVPPGSGLLAAFASPARDLAPDPAASIEPRWSPRVAEARELLAGSTIVVVGGERRPDAVDRLTEAFDLDHVEWMSLTEHASAAPLRAPIMRRETRLVVVLTKLTGHLHAEEARAYAREAGVPFVTMPAGYNPEQVAEQVLVQAGARLRSSTDGP